MHRKLLISLICLVPALCLTAIGNAEDTMLDPSAGNGKAVLRSLQHEDIRWIMGRLYTLSYEREFTELELDRMREKNLEALADAAADLVKIADRLPGLFPDEQLSDEDQVTFRAMANQLQDETLHLLDTASTSSYSERKTGYRELEKTCMACHNLFRDQ